MRIVSYKCCLDVEEDIPPRWRPKPTLFSVENVAYKLESVPLTSVSLVTNKTFKVMSLLLGTLCRVEPWLEA